MAQKLFVITVLIVAVAGCRQRTALAPETAAAPVVNVAATDFAFSPRKIEVGPGKVRFVVANKGTVEHEFMILGVAGHAAHGDHGSHTLQPGTAYQLEVALKPGSYKVVCDLPGHKEAGMVGTLIVH